MHTVSENTMHTTHSRVTPHLQSQNARVVRRPTSTGAFLLAAAWGGGYVPPRSRSETRQQHSRRCARESDSEEPIRETCKFGQKSPSERRASLVKKAHQRDVQVWSKKSIRETILGGGRRVELQEGRIETVLHAAHLVDIAEH